MIVRNRESKNPQKVIRVTLMENYGEIGKVLVNLSYIHHTPFAARPDADGPRPSFRVVLE